MKRTVIVLTFLGLIGCSEPVPDAPEKTPDQMQREKNRQKVIDQGNPK